MDPPSKSGSRSTHSYVNQFVFNIKLQVNKLITSEIIEFVMFLTPFCPVPGLLHSSTLNLFKWSISCVKKRYRIRRMDLQ